MMKNFFLIAVVFMVFTACNNDSDDHVLPLNTVEGKWLWSPDNKSIANTMYEFKTKSDATIPLIHFGTH